MRSFIYVAVYLSLYKLICAFLYSEYWFFLNIFIFRWNTALNANIYIPLLSLSINTAICIFCYSFSSEKGIESKVIKTRMD